MAEGVQIDDLSIRLSSTLDSKLNSDIKNISNNLGKMSRSLEPLKSSSLTGSLKGFASGIKGISNSFGTFGKNAQSGGMGIAKFTKAIVVARTAIWGLKRAMGVFSESIELASNLTEVNNIVDHVFGNYTMHLEDLADSSIKNFGISELTLKRYAAQFQAMGTTMGITDEMVSDAIQSMEGMGKAVNDTGKFAYESTGNMADMATSIAEWTADIASFYDMDYEAAAEKAQALYTGMVRPLIIAA